MMFGNASTAPLTPALFPVAGGEGAFLTLAQRSLGHLWLPLPRAGEAGGEGESESIRDPAALAFVADREGA